MNELKIHPLDIGEWVTTFRIAYQAACDRMNLDEINAIESIFHKMWEGNCLAHHIKWHIAVGAPLADWKKVLGGEAPYDCTFHDWQKNISSTE